MRSASSIFSFLLGAAALAVCACGTADPARGSAPDAVWIDVRTPEEYRSGHAEGAVLIPHTEIRDRIGSVAPHTDQPLMLYCRSGRRSGIAAQALQDLGYRQVTNVGGLDEARRLTAFTSE